MKTNNIHSYKRRIILIMVSVLCIGIIYKAIRERDLYMVYLNNEPVAVTSVKPETVLEVYGDVKAMRYSQGEQEISDEISITEINDTTNMKILNDKELTESLYITLDDKDPVLPGKSKQYFTHTESYEAPCKYIYNDEMYEGEFKTISEGREGLKEVTVVAMYFKGKELERKPLDSEIIQEAVPRVVHIGTKERPDYVIPVIGYTFTSGFGPRWGRNHNGIDLAVPVGTDVHASADGVVTQSGWNGGYGISVCIDHGNGVVTRYAHMSSNDVAVGQEVKQGDYIGLSGNTGDSTGPHVHFEVIVDGAAVDPFNYAEDVESWDN